MDEDECAEAVAEHIAQVRRGLAAKGFPLTWHAIERCIQLFTGISIPNDDFVQAMHDALVREADVPDLRDTAAVETWLQSP